MTFKYHAIILREDGQIQMVISKRTEIQSFSTTTEIKSEEQCKFVEKDATLNKTQKKVHDE